MICKYTQMWEVNLQLSCKNHPRLNKAVILLDILDSYLHCHQTKQLFTIDPYQTVLISRAYVHNKHMYTWTIGIYHETLRAPSPPINTGPFVEAHYFKWPHEKQTCVCFNASARRIRLVLAWTGNLIKIGTFRGLAENFNALSYWSNTCCTKLLILPRKQWLIINTMVPFYFFLNIPLN